MPQIRERSTEAAGSEISDADVRFLRAHLESMANDGVIFYIDAPTIEILAEDHAPSLLINHLRFILAKRECVDVELLNAAPPEDDEIAGVIDRRSAPRSADVGGISTNGSEDAAVTGRDDEVLINEKPLKCLVCKTKAFVRRAAATEGGPRSYICTSCGFVHWFVDLRGPSA